MQRELTESGWNNYSLFLSDVGLLVGYFETDDLKGAHRGMALREVHARWQAEMTRFFTKDGPPEENIAALPEIFHLA